MPDDGPAAQVTGNQNLVNLLIIGVIVVVLWFALVNIIPPLPSTDGLVDLLEEGQGGNGALRCAFTFGGSWNIYEDPKYCVPPDHADTDDPADATECIWYVQNGCTPGSDPGCTAPPRDRIPRQDLCALHPCRARDMFVAASDAKYGWPYFEVCIPAALLEDDAVEAIPIKRRGASKAPPTPLPRELLEPYTDIWTALDPVCSGRPAPQGECPEGMVFIGSCGGFCIDLYEASRGPRGGAQSKPRRRPWTDITWNGAQRACMMAGKRLCKDFEWVAACNLDGDRYGLTEEEDDEQYGCATRPVANDTGLLTGSRSKCRSDAGVHDMIGNVWEWTDARVPDDSWTGKGGSIGELMGTNPTRYGHDALYRNSVARGNTFLRGGGRYGGTGESEERGCFNLALGAEPGYSLPGIGFRCCADPE
ncbi:MAG: SUMF1/EgtB/PvdO family nonheme iron enzyme [Candidatus Undinarchaeales archaeon]|jgi:hypothetical protein|nr:SUMF1/EgtB/PvdO family nonheme iron enzyme [Candidatus Undinarchaeales archaeon]MDP7492290.1 SUMF1/EgtB/PvdO family nonheme iron enzyme [Candidatus Undinarchaeales archaeon]